MRRAARTDSTQAAIVAALRGVGARVWVVGGAVDIVCQFRGQVYLIDAKSKGTRHTPRQKAMVADGWTIHFAHSVNEALYAIGAIEYRVEKRSDTSTSISRRSDVL